MKYIYTRNTQNVLASRWANRLIDAATGDTWVLIAFTKVFAAVQISEEGVQTLLNEVTTSRFKLCPVRGREYWSAARR